MTLAEIEARLAEIHAEIERRGDSITPEDLDTFENEVKNLKAERSQLTRANERRQALLNDVAASGTTRTIRSFPTPGQPQEERTIDRFDTPEYRNAFMEYVCRGTSIPVEMRANEMTTSSDAGAVIPTATSNEIIRELKSYGAIYEKVRKLNVPAGVSFPILSLKPKAHWIGEAKSSDDQKLAAKEKVTFTAFGLECKIAQSLLASVVTYAAFQELFVPMAVEAIIEALEKGIFMGTGEGQMMGILNDTRIPAENKITVSAADFTTWEGWKKKIFGKMKKAYRAGVFVMAQGTFDGYIDGMVDANGQPIGRVNYGMEGEEKYRFGGKTVETVENDVIKGYDEAAAGDVVAVFVDLSNYAINSNMGMQVVKWVDHDDNTVKNKCLLICDGKLLDAAGVLIIKKGE